MKKVLSVFLAALMLLLCMAPAFAADPAGAYTVTFTQPSAAFEGAYSFVKSVDGVAQFVEDPDGIYVFYDNRYMTLDNIFESYWDQVPPERYSPEAFEPTVTLSEGEVLSFQVVTSPEYNAATVAVFINGVPAEKNVKGEYTVMADQNLTIHVAEHNDNNEPVLLKNHYNVTLSSGDGYRVRTLKDENYSVVYYGGSFCFRIKAISGYTLSAAKVAVQRGSDMLSDVIGEDFGMIGNLTGKNEMLTSYGEDSEGYRLYKIDNITSDCKVIVSGVREEKSAGILSFLKRILRLILAALGIKIDALDKMTSYHNVTIDSTAANNVTYKVLRSGIDDNDTDSSFTCMNGDGASIVVTKKSLDQNVNVFWTPGNETGTYSVSWRAEYDYLTGETLYSAVYNIENITADTVVKIIAG